MSAAGVAAGVVEGLIDEPAGACEFEDDDGVDCGNNEFSYGTESEPRSTTSGDLMRRTNFSTCQVAQYRPRATPNGMAIIIAGSKNLGKLRNTRYAPHPSPTMRRSQNRTASAIAIDSGICRLAQLRYVPVDSSQGSSAPGFRCSDRLRRTAISRGLRARQSRPRPV